VKGIKAPNKAIAADDASLIRPTKIDFYHRVICIPSPWTGFPLYLHLT
jgi:hypothetical protein